MVTPPEWEGRKRFMQTPVMGALSSMPALSGRSYLLPARSRHRENALHRRVTPLKQRIGGNQDASNKQL